ncbi:MAG TPA: hypothetical protein PLO23_07105, partial [Alphaproteobacteria bacterium]|nr:hypothetical protein [Alphaproteobacteria bacterium]
MAAHQARTEVITSVGNINLQPLAQIFSNRKAALRVFQQEETIKIPVRVELDQKGKFQFVADIPADDNAEDRLKTLKTVLERFYEHFVPENEATEKKKRIFNLDTVRKHMTSLKAKAANAERRHAADAEKAGQTPNVTPTFALVQTAPPVTAAVVS